MGKKPVTAAFRSELLGMCAANSGSTPVAIVTLRLNPKENFKSLQLMLDRPTLERFIEDAQNLLNTSPALQKGKHNQTTLAETEALHQKL